MSEWISGVLTDITDIIMGQSPEGKTCNELGIGCPLLNGPTEFGVKFPQPLQFTEDPKKISRINDILFCVRGSTTGRMNWADREYAIGRGLAAIRHKKGVEYRYFIRGILDYYLPHLLVSATGSTFPNVSKSQLENLEILIPPLPEQRAIASVLSSLDDKIDLLHRQNKTLEALAETLFRQWFVEGISDTEYISLGKVIQTTSGGTPSRSHSEYYQNGTISWVKSKELIGTYILETEEKITASALKNSSAKLLPAETILIAMYGATVGQYGILAHSAACNQAVCALLPNEHYPYTFLFIFVKMNKEYIETLAVGSAQQNISQVLIKDLQIPKASHRIIEYHNTVAPLFEKIKLNYEQIRTLESLRDTLLPKLMSGEVRVQYNEQEETGQKKNAGHNTQQELPFGEAIAAT